MTRPPNWIEQQFLVAPGMDQSIDPRHLPIGTPQYLQNVRVRQGGRIEKRPGYVSISGGTAGGLPSAADSVWAAEFHDAAVIGVQSAHASGRQCAVYARDDAGQWDFRGRTGYVVPERRCGIQGDAGRTVSVVVVDGVIYIARVDADITCWIYALSPTGTLLRCDQVASADRARLLYVNSTLYLVYQDSGATSLAIRTITPSTLTIGSATALTPALSTSGTYFDVCAVEDGSTWLLVVPTSATNIDINLMTGSTVTATQSITTTGTAARVGVAAQQDGAGGCVGYLDGTTIEAVVFTVSSSALGALTTASVRAATGAETYDHQVGVVRMSSSQFVLLYGGDDDTSAPIINTRFICRSVVTTAGVVSGTVKIPHFSTCSKPIGIGTTSKRVLVWATNANDTSTGDWALQACHYLLEVDGDGGHIAGISYEHLAFPGSTQRLFLPEVASLGSGRYATALNWNDPGVVDGVDLAVFKAALVTESMGAAGRLTHSSDGALCISGGALYEHAGAEYLAPTYIAENGFAYDPEIDTALAAGGSLTSGREYSYTAVYRYIDPRGRVHRSAPSRVVTATPSGADLTVSVRVATLGASGRFCGDGPEVVAEVYRSWNGGPYYYCGATSSVDGTGGTTSVAYTDSAADTSVEDNHVLYTDLGILPTEPPSGARIVFSSGQRLHTVGWRPNVMQHSKLYIATAPWEFVDDDAFRTFFPEDITAGATMDGAIVAWSKRSIFVVTGDGPNDQGVGAFSEPRRVPATVGADYPHVVESQDGLIFFGGGTFWLLPRGFGSPVDIGTKVQTVIGTYPYLRSACRVVNEDDDCCHFVLASTDTNSAATVVAVWNNQTRGWSVDVGGGLQDVGAAAAVDGKFTYVAQTWTSVSGGVPVRQLSNSTVGDNSDATWIESRVRLGEARPFGPLGWGKLSRVQIHGEMAGLCALNLVTVVDGVTGLAVATGVSAGQFYREHAPRAAAGGAFQFEIYDARLTAVNAGLVLHGMAFYAEQEPGLRRLSNSERF